MRNRGSFSALRWFSLLFVLFAVILFTLQLARFSRLRANFPAGLTIGGIPVSGLDRQQAAERLLEAYSVPVELHYGTGEEEAVIQMSPAVVGFELDVENMLAAADQARTRQPFWSSFWDFLWGRNPEPVDIPLKISYSPQRLRTYLQDEISTRYDHPATSAVPVAGTIKFAPGTAGTALDVDRSMLLIDIALHSRTDRIVYLPLQSTDPGRPAFQNLEILLKQTIDLAKFDGILGLSLVDLQTAQDLHFIYYQGKLLPPQSGPAFTGGSTIKIPIMISAFRRLPDKMDDETQQKVEDMIGKSSNPATDWVIQHVVDPSRGPLVVTEDARLLGLQDTFLAGYFALGSPLLMRYKTPANQRADITTEADPYNQTTPYEMSMLLEDLYQCAQNGGGALIAVFPDQITQDKCKLMIDLLIKDRAGALIQGGLPDGTKIAHKHGWVTDSFGIIHDMSDAAIVYTPGGNFILTLYLYHPTQLVYEPTQQLVENLARAVYNYYNLP